MFSKNRKLLGFTLIELLVVISIIALLMAILFPALNKAKQQAQKLVCGTHLKDIAKGAMLFAADNNDWLPMTDGTSLPGSKWANIYPQRSYWYMEIASYMSLSDHPYIKNIANHMGYSWKASENVGIEAPGIYLCPSKKRSEYYGLKPLAYGWNWNGLGYKYKTYFSGYNDAVNYWAPWRLSNIKSAYVTGMVGENPIGNDPALDVNCPRDYWGGLIADMYVDNGRQDKYYFYGKDHGGGSNYVCIDGHIEFRNYEEFVESYEYYRNNPSGGKQGGSILYPDPRRWQYSN